MKRLFLVLLTVLLLTSCSPTVAPLVTSGFICKVSIQYDDRCYAGTLEVKDDAQVRLTVEEPATVNGLQLLYSNEELTASFAGMDLVLSETQVPAAAVVRFLAKTLNQARDQEGTVRSTEHRGSLDGVSYSLCFDEENGMPLKLAVPSYALTVSFSEWESIEEL